MSQSVAAENNALRDAVLAGLVTTVVGFTSSFAVVLAGLTAAGATANQAASGLLTLTMLTGISCIVLSSWHRVPVTVAWSTPGAALLAGLAPGNFSFAQAVGAFIVSGVLIMLTGLVPALQRLMAAIPVSIAQGMLAGILIPLCLKPFTALSHIPIEALAILLAFLVALRKLPKYAVGLSMLVALAIGLWHIAAHGAWAQISAVPSLELVVPEFSLAAVASISLPLFIVTMASQNIPGVAVMSTFGYTTPWRSSMLVTGAGSAAGAFFGGHAINLAAISAALAAGEAAGSNPALRWRAATSSGVFYLLFAAGSVLIASVAAASPAGLFEAAAGLALLATLANALGGALADPAWRFSALATLLVATSNLTLFGIGGAFWALLIGLGVHLIAERS
ncbi:benzoate/H(+) symporter BenE family transporter [Glutamicibacter endophyticus]